MKRYAVCFAGAVAAHSLLLRRVPNFADIASLAGPFGFIVGRVAGEMVGDYLVKDAVKSAVSDINNSSYYKDWTKDNLTRAAEAAAVEAKALQYGQPAISTAAGDVGALIGAFAVPTIIGGARFGDALAMALGSAAAQYAISRL